MGQVTSQSPILVCDQPASDLSHYTSQISDNLFLLLQPTTVLMQFQHKSHEPREFIWIQMGLFLILCALEKIDRFA